MNLIEVKFERPNWKERDLGVEWDFTAEFDTDHVLDGNAFGGQLRRIEVFDGKPGWIANQGDRKGRPAETREGAIRSLQPVVYAAYIAHKKEMEEREAEYSRRLELRKSLLADLPAGFRLSVSGGSDVPVNCPLSFHISVPNLTEADVRKLAAILSQQLVRDLLETSELNGDAEDLEPETRNTIQRALESLGV